ncbi:hypothetical protein [Thiorhodococcus fuscus]|uniref:Thaumarchaeal output domain-containing protein n=1 Tax=Thiorhodococcus fuscus TaxID=527200 RepID=A0ABW4Y5I1_9GAMM
MEKHEIILQPFSDKLGDFWLEFPCPHCNEIVKATRKIQRQLAFGSVGHKCSNCDTYYAFFRCPCCGKITGFDDREWNLLTTPEGAKCPSCNASLYRKKETWLPTLMGIASYTPSLSQWSSSDKEKLYLGKIRQTRSPDQQATIALRHHSVGVRVKSAKKSLDFLIKEKWYIPFSLSNSQELKIQKKYAHPLIMNSMKMHSVLLTT